MLAPLVAVALATVSVPAVQLRELPSAYTRLHRAGLRVSVEQSFAATELDCRPVGGQSPAAGTRVLRGIVVTLRLAPSRCGAGSPGVPVGGFPFYRVPDFRGRSVSSASTWAGGHSIELDATLPPLRAGAAPTLLGNYIVVRQRPRAGARLSGGVATPGGGFLVTPLTVTAVQALDGVLTGSIRFVGGPAPPRPTPSAAGRVAVFASPRIVGSDPFYASGRRVASATVAAGHSYRFVLPAGRYTIGRVGGSDCPPGIVIVWPGRTAHLDVDVGCTVL